jgi:hypothetical protein
MKFELIDFIWGISLTASRTKYKVVHLKSSGRTEQRFKPAEALKYVEDYCTSENFKIINVTTRILGLTIFLSQD